MEPAQVMAEAEVQDMAEEWEVEELLGTVEDVELLQVTEEEVVTEEEELVVKAMEEEEAMVEEEEVVVAVTGEDLVARAVVAGAEAALE